ncbi:hypothetical protein BpHYR1_005588 [Brachionus plicatilis]|uniref:Uncharacterized protein n=1 Tax=Brachionus plicatilis TaxID=10195 RepID=A0A3M7RIF4_BRAPC|nr:hypothetical protein BpHYR1_005588 [Brachionus plicatilis]
MKIRNFFNLKEYLRNLSNHRMKILRNNETHDIKLCVCLECAQAGCKKPNKTDLTEIYELLN